MWTRFMDMHSGGGMKEAPFSLIFIEAPQAEAELIFYNRFGHNPNRVSCTCCGDDYSISEDESLANITGYDRECEHGYVLPSGEEIFGEKSDGFWYALPRERRHELKSVYFERKSTRKWAGEYVTLEQFFAREWVLKITAADIKPEERVGKLPRQGYFYLDETDDQ
jgi:hypothetical protein